MDAISPAVHPFAGPLFLQVLDVLRPSLSPSPLSQSLSPIPLSFAHAHRETITSNSMWMSGLQVLLGAHHIHHICHALCTLCRLSVSLWIWHKSPDWISFIHSFICVFPYLPLTRYLLLTIHPLHKLEPQSSTHFPRNPHSLGISLVWPLGTRKPLWWIWDSAFRCVEERIGKIHTETALFVLLFYLSQGIITMNFFIFLYVYFAIH